MASALAGRRVLLVVGGGIAAYKAPLIVRALIAEGAEVRCVLTRAAQSFVAPLALQAVSQHRVGLELLDTESEAEIGHIELARWPDAILIAPATANLMARMAAGLATDLATTVLLATTAPVIVAPAMNTQMLLHPATQANLERLQGFGHTIVDPDAGELACKEVGPGRQPDPEILVEVVGMHLAPKPLAGARVIVSAGPTRAFLDPVRFISNPSTGRMGVAMARAAKWLGAATATVVAGPGVEIPAAAAPWIERVDVETADEMAGAILARLRTADWLIKAAAVGDWAPVKSLGEKHKKSAEDTDERWVLELGRTRDILKAACDQRRADPEGHANLRIIGFAAETHHLERYARGKLASKGCDAILGNWVRSDAGDTFGSDSVELHAFVRDGWRGSVGPGEKFVVAREILAELAARFSSLTNAPTEAGEPDERTD